MDNNLREIVLLPQETNALIIGNLDKNYYDCIALKLTCNVVKNKPT